MAFKISYNKRNGQIALLLTLVILGAILSIGLGLTLVTIREMKMAKNIEESTMALQAADAGMEEALYIRKTVGLSPGDTGSTTLEYTSYNWETQEQAGWIDIKSIGSCQNIKRAIKWSWTWLRKTVGVVPLLAGSPSCILFSVKIGDGDNNGQNEVYAGDIQRIIHQFRKVGASWQRTEVGNNIDGFENCVALGDGDNDGQNEVYAINYAGGADRHVHRFRWDGASWQSTDLGDNMVTPTSVSVGDGNNNGQNEVYAGVLCNIHQFRWNGALWVKSDVIIDPDLSCYMRSVTVGDGNNDGNNEVYGARSRSEVYQSSWNGSSWSTISIGSGGGQMYDVAVGDGDNDGQNEVYGANGDNHIYQFKWDGASWQGTDVGSGGSRMSNVAVGDGDNDGQNEVYGANEDGHIYLFKWDGSLALWNKIDVGSYGGTGIAPIYDVAVGDGDNDGQNEVYGACGDCHLYQFKFSPFFHEVRP